MLDNNDFDNKAWGNMLELLEQEMPQKKAFPWFKLSIALLLFVMIGSGFGFYFYTNSEDLDDTSSLSALPLYANNQNTAESHSPSNSIDIKQTKLDKTTHYNTNSKNEQTSNDVKPTRSKVTQAYTSSSYSNTNTSNSFFEKKLNHGINSTSDSYSDLASRSKLVNQESESNANQTFTQDFVNPFASNALKHVESKKSINSFSLAVLESEALDWEADKSELSVISAEHALALNAISRARRVNFYAYVESNYIPDFRSLGYKLGGLVELGAQKSPWSVSTGLLFETSTLKELANRESDLVENIPDSSGSVPTGIEDKLNDASSLISVSYLNIPLQFHYRFNKIKIGVGIQNKLLIGHRLRNGQNTLPTYFQDFDRNTEQVDQGGINNYHLSANQSLVYRIHPKIDLGIAFQYDLTGIFSDNSFTTNNIYTANRLDNIGLSLAYKFN